MSPLAKVAQINPPLSVQLPLDEPVSFVPMAAVSAETARVETSKARPYSEVSKGYTAFRSGDILFAKITPCFENGKIAQALLPLRHGFGSTEFHVIRPVADVSDGRYLHHFLRLDRVRSEGQRRMTGSGGQRRVPANYLAELAIPLPPLPEQRRIAAILDQAETLRTQRRAALAQLDSLTQSLFLDMFGDPVTNERNWPQDYLGRLTLKMGSGSTPTGGDAAYKAEGISLIRSLNVHDGAFKYKNLAFLDDQQAGKLSNVQVEANDVLLNITGASVARVCRAPSDVLPARVNQHVMIIRPKAALNCVFLERLLLSNSMKNSLLQIGGSGATREAITKAQAEELVVPLPPLLLQHTFATRAQAIEALKAKHRASLAQLDALFASLQHRAFNGELTAQAPALPKPRRFAELGQLDASKGLEALVYAVHRLSNKGHYWPLKVQYVADRRHLERHGRTLYGETHVAMPYGPVPQAAFNASRALANGELLCEFPMDAVRAALRRDGEALVALRDADPVVLDADERESLDWAIRLVADMSFAELKNQTHDSAWGKTPRNEPLAWQDIIESLAPAARQRLLGQFE